MATSAAQEHTRSAFMLAWHRERVDGVQPTSRDAMKAASSSSPRSQLSLRR